MMKQEVKLLINLHIYFAAALIVAVGQDNVYHRCRDSPISDNSRFTFSCDSGRVIIVKLALVGAADAFTQRQCPMTHNTCMKQVPLISDLCTGHNSCDINQNILLYNETKLSCPQNGDTVGNFIYVDYTCIFPDANYGDICHFDADLFSNSTIYISSFPNFPNAMGPEANYQCSCKLKSKPSSFSAYVVIRTLLVKLVGVNPNCSERLSIIASENETKLEFCSPCNNVNNITTVPLVSDPEILFWRGSFVSPNNGKFILEITVLYGSGSMGRMKCGSVGSTILGSTNVTATSSSYTPTTTTSAILSLSNGFSSTGVQNTLPGMTVRWSDSTEQGMLSSSRTATGTQNIGLSYSKSEPIGYRPNAPTVAGQSTSEKNSLPIGGIVGIVLGSVGLLVIVIIVLLCLLRKKKRHHGRSKGNPSFKIPKSLTVIQNLHRTSTIELHDATSSESHTFQSAEHFNSEPQTGGYENNGQRKDDYVSNYEEGAPVPHITNGPGMFPTNQRGRLNDKMADDRANENLSRNSGSDDVTLVENQLYGENEITVTDGATSSLYDVVRPDTSSSHYDVARSVATSSDYDVVRPVVQDVGTNESAEVDRGYAQTKNSNSSADHSYYNVPIDTRVQPPPAEVSGIETTDPMHNADSDVILIDNTLYGSTFLMSNH